MGALLTLAGDVGSWMLTSWGGVVVRALLIHWQSCYRQKWRLVPSGAGLHFPSRKLLTSGILVPGLATIGVCPNPIVPAALIGGFRRESLRRRCPHTTGSTAITEPR